MKRFWIGKEYMNEEPGVTSMSLRCQPFGTEEEARETAENLVRKAHVARAYILEILAYVQPATEIEWNECQKGKVE